MRVVPLMAAVIGILAATTASADLAGEVASARERWAAHGPNDYRFTISQGCYCRRVGRGPVTVTVVDGEVSLRRTSFLDPPVVRTPLHITMPQLFEWIEEELRQHPTANFNLEFDSFDGHPTRFKYVEPSVTDSWMTIVVDEFKRL